MLRRLLRHPGTCLVLTLLVAGLLSTMVALLLGALGVQADLGAITPHRMLVQSLPATVGTTLALLAVGGKVERRSPAALGLGLRGAAADLGRGLLGGGGLMGTVVGVLALLGWYRLGGTPEPLQEELREALQWAGALAVAGFLEEVLFRGILFRLLEEWLGSAAALLLSSAVFGLVHLQNPDASLLATLAIALEAGLLLGGAYMLTRTLWLATGVHVAWNWTQGPLFGLDVSGARIDGLLEGEVVGPVAWTGGAFGPEAGGVALLLGTAAGVLLTTLAARRGQWRPLLHWRRQRRAGAAP